MSASSTRLSTPIGTPKPSYDGNISHPAHKLLSRGNQNDSETVNKIFTDKIVHKPLLLNQSTDHIDKRAARRHIRLRKKAYALKHARPKPLSAKEKRKLKLYELRPQDCRFEVYQNLNQLWQRYILEVLGYLDREGNVVPSRIGSAVTANSAGSSIASADFHGMEIEVVKSADVGRIGLKGIVVRETRSTFTVVCNEKEDSARKLRNMKHGHQDVAAATQDAEAQSGGQMPDKVRKILKKGTVFRVAINLPPMASRVGEKESDQDVGESAKSTGVRKDSKRQLVFELHGSVLETRPTERASKKFKFQWKAMDDL